MSYLKTLKRRIVSIESTKKITSSMKLVASSYFKKAEQRRASTVPYIQGVTHTLEAVLHFKKVSEFKLIRGGCGSNHLLVMMTGNRGLCGGFNTNIGRYTETEIAKLIKLGKKVKLITIGSKASFTLSEDTRSLIVGKFQFQEKDTWVNVSALSRDIQLWIQNGEVDSCSVIYSVFHSLLFSEMKSHTLVPYSESLMRHNRNFRSSSSPSPLLFGLEPSFGSMLIKASFENLKAQLYFAALESQASEHSARMMAMDSATKNSEDILRKLRLGYNRTRQSNITRELVEIIAGAESI